MAAKTPDATEVLIVGAGPSGLMAAELLTRWGVKIRIIDDNDGPSVHSKAMAMQARSLEAFDQLGIADDAVTEGRPASWANIFSDDKRLMRVPFGNIGKGISPFPYLLILPQDRTEHILGADLAEHGVTVEWRTRLESFTEAADGITATVSRNGKSQTIAAQWLIGADGASSTVRQQLGIPFEGDTYAHHFYVADVKITGLPVEGELNMIFSDRFRFAATFPMAGDRRFRLVGMVPDTYAEPDLTFDDLEPYFAEAMNPLLTLSDPDWFSTYRVHHLVAERFSKGRVFLVGDSAHVHSPVGGQGMNTGLQDAYNLAWKLALVVGRAAPASLLDSYHAERHPNAVTLVKTTDAAFSQIIRRRPGWASRALRAVFGTMGPLLVRSARFQRRMFGTLSQTKITYRKGPLSRSGMPGKVRAGDRLPWFRVDGVSIYDVLRPDRFTLIAVGSARAVTGAEDLASELIHVHRVATDKAGPLREGLYLVRPDGYLGTTARSAAEIRAYLAEVMGLTTRSG